MAHTLVVVRHAKSDWSVPVGDRERPLAPRGRRQAPAAGQWIAGHLALEELVEILMGEWTRLPTSALAVIELPTWQSSTGRLLAAGRPADETVHLDDGR